MAKTSSPSLKYRQASLARNHKEKSRLSESSSSEGSSSASAEPASAIEEVTREVEVTVDDLDESLSYAFQDGQSVWVKVDKAWVLGVVSGKGTRKIPTRSSVGVAYPVIYGMRKRRFFAPLNGDIKPDIPAVQALLQEGGWA